MGVNLQTIKDIRSFLAGQLQGLYPEREASSIAGIVISDILGIRGTSRLMENNIAVTGEQAEKAVAACNELLTGRPVQYVTGETVFYDCRIKVNSSVLIPRPETEELVHLIINENRSYAGHVLDIGTGSGCIAIVLASRLPLAGVTATDISEDAIGTARENADLNRVNVTFVTEDILGPATGKYGKAGLIVSNPPYVRNSEKSLMHKNVLDFEPHSALFVDDGNPMLYYRAVLDRAEEFLLPEGRIYFEINEAAGQEIRLLLEKYGYSAVSVIKDLNGRDRMAKGIKNG